MLKPTPRLYNTLTAKKEPLKIPSKGLNLFVCGPTVYDNAHIGHARTYLAFDIFARFLRATGINIFYLQNITDIDDKIIARAQQENKNPLALSKEFTREYLTDMKTLGIRSVNRYAPASQFIPPIIQQIKTLIKKGHAYKIDKEGWYFDLKTFPEYGKLAKRTAEQAEDSVSRIDQGINKRNKGDFCLWKFTKAHDDAEFKNAERRKKKFIITQGEPAWFTDLGWGRPGWHIEDTAITESFFGPQYDIHGGGVDIKFPHHESEIAQQEAASGKKPFVKIWMHTGHLLVKGKKMSKSLHNFVTIRDFLNSHSPAVLRYLTISHHYRSPMNYTPQAAEQARNALHNIEKALGDSRSLRKNADTSSWEKKFFEALADDFNTPRALAILWDVIKDKKLSAAAKRQTVLQFDKVLGLGLKSRKSSPAPAAVATLAQKREAFRKNKQFIQADRLRKEIEDLGYTVSDTANGPRITKK